MSKKSTKLQASQFERESQLFEELAEASPIRRQQMLNALEAESSELSLRLQKLLYLHHEAETSTATAGASVSSQERLTPGSYINDYQVIDFLGAGGEADVYLVEQKSPFVRSLALKLLRRQHSSSVAYLARFQAEKSALAQLDHPLIAKLYDAGTTVEGKHYCVVEYVKGPSITQYVTQQSLSLKERLRLFCEVCNAIQYANENGVLHRDIKPSNIIVTSIDGRPRPIVIDFGIAKIMPRDDQPHETLTQRGDLLGTLGYMAPERLQDARIANFQSEVYALGALLYELISGAAMIKIDKSSGIVGGIQLVTEHVVVKPSQRVLENDHTKHPLQIRRQLSRQIAGDLDWISIKAVEKSPQQRYESVRELRKDILRFLDGHPVEAAPPKRIYQMRKFYHRHRSVCILSGLLLTSLIILVCGSTYWALRLDAANKVANQLVLKTQNDSLHMETVLEFLIVASETEFPHATVAVCGEQLFKTPALETSKRRDFTYFSGTFTDQDDLPPDNLDALGDANLEQPLETPLLTQTSSEAIASERVRFFEYFLNRQISKFGESNSFVLGTLLQKARVELVLSTSASRKTLQHAKRIMDNLAPPANPQQCQQYRELLEDAQQISSTGNLQ